VEVDPVVLEQYREERGLSRYEYALIPSFCMVLGGVDLEERAVDVYLERLGHLDDWVYLELVEVGEFL